MPPYTLIRSKRKTISISIRDGLVTVRAPLFCAQSEIERFILLKREWVEQKLSISRQQMSEKQAFALNYGDTLLFRGNLYTIASREGARAGFNGECFHLPPDLCAEQIKNACIKVYHKLAKAHLSERVSFFGEQMNLFPSSVKVNNAKARWGSCSSQGSINFSWRIIMASDDVIDYVVVHELAHLRHMNHSSEFWETVERFLPDYRKRNRELKGLQRRLAKEDW